MTLRRRLLAGRRKALGYSQESLAEHMSVDRLTVARWERGECEPQPCIRPKLAKMLQVTPLELDDLLTLGRSEPLCEPSAQRAPAPVATLQVVSGPDADVDERDDMNRRELLCLLSVAGTLTALPQIEAAPVRGEVTRALETSDTEQYETLNAHLWQVYSLSTSKGLVYPLVRQQLSLLTGSLQRAHSETAHERLCVLAGDLFQLAGEIFFDGDRYTDAAHCYTLAASACKEAGAYDLWACALTRHSFISMYERRFTHVTPMLDAASRIAGHGDDKLPTRYWVAAVQAEAYAGLGDYEACSRALDIAGQVRSLPSDSKLSGWLRFDGSRLAEELGTCYIALGKPELAEVALSEALAQDISLRRRGSVLADLATLSILRHDVEQAVHYGTMAAELAQQTRSRGYIGRKLQGLQRQLAPLLSDPRLSSLSDQISHLSD